MANLLRKIIRDTHTLPMLTDDEERAIVARAKAGDRRAMDRLALTHTRLCLGCATAYRHYGFPVEDLYQEGCVGLMQAVERFDPARGVRFATFASWWIKAAIREYALRNVSLVRIGTNAAQKALFFQGRSARAKLQAEMPYTSDAEIHAALAERFGLPVGDVERILSALSGGDWSLDVALNAEEGTGDSMLDFLADGTPLADEVLADEAVERRHRNALATALTFIDGRERDIFQRRVLAEKPATLEVLSAEYGVSKERVRQIGVRAYDKVAAGARRAVRA